MITFSDHGYLDTRCVWCGRPGASGEPIEVVQVSRREALWMHPDCAALYSERCKKDEEKFYASAVKFARGEPSDIVYGTVGEVRAKITKKLIAERPVLALPKNWQELRDAVAEVEHARAVADGYAFTLSDEEVGDGTGAARLRAIADAVAKATRTALIGRRSGGSSTP